MKPDAETLQEIVSLIAKLRLNLIWRPGSARRHLLKRKLRGHLSGTATLEEYERLIQDILEDTEASVYLYSSGDTTFLTISSNVGGKVWVVIASFDGVMETAFVVENPASYLHRSNFLYVGSLGEVS